MYVHEYLCINVYQEGYLKQKDEWERCEASVLLKETVPHTKTPS